MIFSETVNKKTQFTSPVYICKAHFLVKYLFFYFRFLCAISVKSMKTKIPENETLGKKTQFISPVFFRLSHFRFLKFEFHLSIALISQLF